MGIDVNYNIKTVPDSIVGGVGAGIDIVTDWVKSLGSDNVKRGSLSGTAGPDELPFPDATLDGIDWDTLTEDLATSGNMMVSLSAIMTLLIEVMSQMRQNQREVALADAQNALQAGLNASAAMKQAAAFALGAGLTSGALNVISGSVSVKQSQSQLDSMTTAKSKVDDATKQLEAAEAKMVGATRNKANSAADDLELPKTQAKKDETDLELEARKEKVADKDQKDLELAQANSAADDPELPKTQAKKDETDLELEARKEKVADKDQKDLELARAGRDVVDARKNLDRANKDFHETSTSVHIEGNITRAKLEVMSGISNMLASSMNFFAESARAEVKADEAQAQYEQSIQQADQAFFQQLGDSIRAMMQSWQSADRSTHEASQAIYNV